MNMKLDKNDVVEEVIVSTSANIEDVKRRDFSSLQIKKYIPLALKQAIICGEDNDGIASRVIDEVDGMKEKNIFNYEALTAIVLVREYTNVDMGSDEDLIDNILASGIVNVIVEECDDACLFLSLLDKKIDKEIEKSNSIQMVLAKGIKDLIAKMPDEKGLKKIMDSFPKILNKVEPERLKTFKDMFVADKGKVG